jgi:dihydropteroate synthase
MRLDRPATWTLRSRSLDLSVRPLVMGILNVTPDSFSDGGQFVRAEMAIEQALSMEAAGADIIDVGGESTRPYSDPVEVESEWQRVGPVLAGLQGQLKIPVSIDTSKAEIASRAIEAGVEIINDVTGLEGDPSMVRVARDSKAGVCAMHMRGTPQTMQDDPSYEDVVREIGDYLRQRLEFLIQEGIERDRICLDPGIGFGKLHRHNLDLIRSVDRFHELGCPLLVGHSRKGFIAKQLGNPEKNRMAGTLGVSLALAQQGVQVLRVHDVAETVDALRLFQVSGGLEGSQWSVASVPQGA